MYLFENFPGREAQIEKLVQLYGRKDEPFVDALYVHGVTSTGKSSVVKTALEIFEIKHAVVDLIRCNTTKILFENILLQLSSSVKLSDVKCDNLMDFTWQLRNMHLADEQAVVVVDKAERFRNMDANLLPAFLRLRELANVNVSVILISTLEFGKLVQKLHVAQPITLYYRQYTRDEILKILESNFDPTANETDLHSKIPPDSLEMFYKNYLNVLLSVFYKNCRDLRELRHQAERNFPKYYKPVMNGEINANDVSKLWHNIAPVLKSSLEHVYLRTDVLAAETTVMTTPLPFYAKYLLIASYLASYNPAKEDRRLFSKDHIKKRKTISQMKRKEKIVELLNTQIGPKQFTFDRLLAIFFSILDDKVGLCSNLMSQISSLVQMQLLTAIGEGINLDSHKFKCNVDFEYIQVISKMVGFNIRKYLYDFI